MVNKLIFICWTALILVLGSCTNKPDHGNTPILGYWEFDYTQKVQDCDGNPINFCQAYHEYGKSTYEFFADSRYEAYSWGTRYKGYWSIVQDTLILRVDEKDGSEYNYRGPLLLDSSTMRLAITECDLTEEIVFKRSVKNQSSECELKAIETIELVDSTSVGTEGSHKIVLFLERKNGGVMGSFTLYKSIKNSWVECQTFSAETNGITGLEAKFEDFNDDGFSDLTFRGTMAARGANENRHLLIYNPKSDSLIYIKNSNNYPNLRYNATLNCVDAWAVYAGSSTFFLKLEGDSLREFASVHCMDARDVYEINSQGDTTVLSSKKIGNDLPCVRYKNYKPLEVLEDI